MFETVCVDDLYEAGLRKRRRLACMGVEDLANAIDTTVWSIYDYENGKSKPDLRTGAMLYNITGMHIARRTNSSRKVRTGVWEPYDFHPIIIHNLWGSGLTELREEAGVAFKELAEAMGVTRQTLYRYEKGTRKPDLVTGIRIYNYLNDIIDRKNLEKFG